MAFDPFSIFKSQPDPPQRVPLSQQGKDALSRQVELAERPVAEHAASAWENVDKSMGNIAGSPQATSQAARRLGTNEYFGDAIRNVYQRQAGTMLNQVRQTNDFQAAIRRSQDLAKAARAVLGQQQAITAQNQFLTEAYNQQEAARARFIDQIFQGGMYGIGIAKATSPPKTWGNQFTKEFVGEGMKGGFDSGAGGDFGMGRIS